MSESTSIEWTGSTWNPIRARSPGGKAGWSCVKISPGCANCYAESFNKRLGTGLPYGKNQDVETQIDEAALAKPLSWKRGRKVFVCSMTDLFGEWVSDEMIDKVFAVMALCPQHTFQVLTKRAERMAAYLNDASSKRVADIVRKCGNEAGALALIKSYLANGAARYWPLPNVWLGVSVEDQKRADERIPHLLRTPAAVRFLSCEPMLGPMCIDRWLSDQNTGSIIEDAIKIDWLIVGGESGHGARPMHPDWARAIRDQCQAGGVPFFFKQWGEWVEADKASEPEPVPTKILKGTSCEMTVMQRPPRGICWVDANGPVKIIGDDGKFTGDSPRGICMARVGKKAAGRLLDGRVWDEFPGTWVELSGTDGNPCYLPLEEYKRMLHRLAKES